MSEERLLPCPFCGGEAYINYETMVDERTIYWAQVLCKQCHARSCGSWRNSYTNAEKKEVKAWNTRKPIERIISQAEAEIESSDKYIREYDDSEVQKAFNKGMRVVLEIVKGGGVDAL